MRSGLAELTRPSLIHADLAFTLAVTPRLHAGMVPTDPAEHQKMKKGDVLPLLSQLRGRVSLLDEPVPVLPPARTRATALHRRA